MSKVSRWIRKVAHDEAGQSLVIIAGAFIALMVIVGLAIDLGLMYVRRIELGRACDAAALAAAQELPFEDFAIRRAMQYLRENGFGPQEIHVQVEGPPPSVKAAIEQEWNSQNGPDVIGTVYIDTQQFEDDTAPDPDNSADKILVRGVLDVPMHFMRILGFDKVSISARAIAENVSNVDVAIVYDRSGSMSEDTRCYGCYERLSGQDYPEGIRRYLPYDSSICDPQQPIVYNGYEILVAEAEYFSYSTSYVEHDYHREYYVYPNTYWTMQRNKWSQASGYRAEGYCDGSYHTYGCRRGAHLMHHPHGGLVNGHKTVTSKTPRLDYDFDIPTAGRWYIWARTQCGQYSGTSTRADGCLVHWGVDKQVKGSGYSQSGRGGYDQGSYGYRWTWIRLGYADFDVGTHQVNIWGGGTGFRLDKIVITRNPEGPSSYTDKAPSFIRNTTPSWTDVRSQNYQTYVLNGRYGGPPDTHGRTGFACHKCNPIYGLRVNVGCTVGQAPDANCEDLNGNGRIDYDEICDNTMDDLFDDIQPIRFAKEAAKNFARRMKARFDQLGYVTYSSSASITRELNCVKQRGYPPDSYGRGVWDPDTGPDNAWIWCYDHRTGTGGYTGNPDTSRTDGSIIYAIDQTSPGGSTNIADALQKGIDVLSTQSGHYGRPNAASVMVLMTDGQANTYPNNTCWQQDLFDPPSSADRWDRAKDCVIYYANRARDNNIVIYTIGLGAQADNALLQEVADRTGGVYYYAPKPEDLDAIFQAIADQIFLRLVQ